MEALVAENLQRIKSNIPDNVTLVAVSKTKPNSDIEQALTTGHLDYGENRVQEMTDKYEALSKDIRWHMVGHLQSNKIKYMAPYVHLVHGIDKPKRLKALNKEAEKCDRVVDCLIQIHIAREESKFGFDLEEAWSTLNANLTEKFPNIRVRGLMGMATFTDDEAIVRSEFRGLHEFYQKVKKELNPAHFDILSMGMSNDYKIAIEEGSNMIRIGSDIFGKRD